MSNWLHFAKLGDFVFEDLDADGIQDPNEPGISGVRVNLFVDGRFLTYTTTDANGMYLFNFLKPGSHYQVHFVNPDENVYMFSPRQVGNNPEIDSDGPKSDFITLYSGQFNNTIDTGLFRKTTPPPQRAKLGDFVFNDLNQNGIQDQNEPGIAGATVRLQDPNGNTITTTTTDGNGMYMFNNLLPGPYKVMFVQPQGFDGVSPFLVGNNRAIDSDANPSNGLMSNVVTLAPGEFNRTIDGGFFKTPPPLNPKIDLEKFTNGQDADSPTGPVIDVGGTAIFTYKVRNTGDTTLTNVQVIDDNGTPNNPNDDFKPIFVDGDNNNNGIFDPGEQWIWTASRTVTPGQYTNKAKVTAQASNGQTVMDMDPSNHFGQQVPPQRSKLGDFVFNDLNQNGIQDQNEPGIAGATVRLQNPNGTTLATTTTDGAGMYMFNNLIPGQYKVTFEQPDGFDGVSPYFVGNNRAIDSDANPNNGLMSNVVTLAPGEFNRTIDGGFFKTPPPPQRAKLGDFVFNDLNQNGIQDPNEPGIAGAEVKLQDPSGNTISTTFTDGTGMYMFNDLIPGPYKVMFVQPDGFTGVSPFLVGPNRAIDSDANPNNMLMSNVVTLAPGEFNNTIDAGFFQPPEPAKLGDFVFNDLNQNGIQNPNEPGIAGAEVKLQDPSGNILATTITDANGMYMFSDLTSGSYKVMFVQPQGFDSVSPFLVGNNRAIDSDANPNNMLMSNVVTLAPGEFNSTIDAGFFVGANPAIDIEKLVRVRPTGIPGFPGQDICDTVGKPTTLQLQYIPGTEFNTQQSSKKGEGLVNRGIDEDGNSYVVVSEKENGQGDIYFAGDVSFDETFQVTAEKFSSNTFFSLFDERGGPLLQSARYHTSCSAPIVLGDEIYSLTLTGVQGEDGSAFLPTESDFVDADNPPGPDAIVGSTVEFRYEVTNTGDTPLENIQVTDDRLSSLSFEGGDDNNNNLLDLDETWIYSAQERAKEGLNTNKGTATGTANGIEVMDMDRANYTGTRRPVPSGDVCDTLGKPRALTFEYNPGTDVLTGQKADKAFAQGTPDLDGESFIVVSKKDKLDDVFELESKDTFFAGTVLEGDEFTARGEKFGSNTNIFIFDDQAAFNIGSQPLQTLGYHTSCSQPIRIGDIIGSVELTGYVGEDGAFPSTNFAASI